MVQNYLFFTWWMAVIPDMLILLMSMSTLTLLSILITSSPSLSLTTSWKTISSGNLTRLCPGWVRAKKLALLDILTVDDVIDHWTSVESIFLWLQHLYTVHITSSCFSSILRQCWPSLMEVLWPGSHVLPELVMARLWPWYTRRGWHLLRPLADNFLPSTNISSPGARAASHRQMHRNVRALRSEDIWWSCWRMIIMRFAVTFGFIGKMQLTISYRRVMHCPPTKKGQKYFWRIFVQIVFVSWLMLS